MCENIAKNKNLNPFNLKKKMYKRLLSNRIFIVIKINVKYKAAADGIKLYTICPKLLRNAIKDKVTTALAVRIKRVRIIVFHCKLLVFM
jgi:hypothetical protein